MPAWSGRPIPKRNFDGRLLGNMRIERDSHQYHCPDVLIPLAIQHDLIVVGGVECQPEMRLQAG